MEKITRFHLMHFPFNKQTQTEERYSEAKAALEKSILNINIPENSEGIIASYAIYNKKQHQYLTSCVYKGNLFLGLYDKKDSSISFQDKTEHLAEAGTEECFQKLEYRMNNEISSILHGNMPNPYLKGIRNAWEERLPLLNQILEYDKKVESMQEFERNLLKHSLAYDKAVDMMIIASQQLGHQTQEHAIQDNMEL